MSNTSNQYNAVIGRCRDIFMKKNFDYGTSWRILRQSSITDQIYIKATRIRTIEEKGSSEINEGIEDEFIGIINYSVIALVQMALAHEPSLDLKKEHLGKIFDEVVADTKRLMEAKNSDYGEAWRNMRVSTFTDVILMRLMRIRSIEDNGGETIASEGVDANFQDMINYAVFALIRLDEEKSTI
jgi:hypothetical protein